MDDGEEVFAQKPFCDLCLIRRGACGVRGVDKKTFDRRMILCGQRVSDLDHVGGAHVFFKVRPLDKRFVECLAAGNSGEHAAAFFRPCADSRGKDGEQAR